MYLHISTATVFVGHEVRPIWAQFRSDTEGYFMMRSTYTTAEIFITEKGSIEVKDAQYEETVRSIFVRHVSVRGNFKKIEKIKKFITYFFPVHYTHKNIWNCLTLALRKHKGRYPLKSQLELRHTQIKRYIFSMYKW